VPHDKCIFSIMRASAAAQISVVIPCAHVDLRLECCLQSLALQNVDHRLFEVILVLDGTEWPADRSQTIGAEHSFRVYCTDSSGKPQGRSKARNLGIQNSHAQVIVCIDADMVAHPGLIAAYLDLHSAGQYAGVGVRKTIRPYQGIDCSTESGLVRLMNDPALREDVRSRFYRATDDLRNAAEPFWAFFSCNCSFPRDLGISVGLFDEELVGWGLEDQEFGYRLWKTNASLFYCVPDAIAVHLDHPVNKLAQNGSKRANQHRCIQKHGDVFAQTHYMSSPRLQVS
jgi:glycosyltransferase involved in cell wall biosynthesis